MQHLLLLGERILVTTAAAATAAVTATRLTLPIHVGGSELLLLALLVLDIGSAVVGEVGAVVGIVCGEFRSGLD